MYQILFREASEEEKENLKKWIDNSFGIGIFSRILESDILIVGEGDWKEYFKVSENMYRIFKKISKHRMPYCLGIYIARYFRNHYELSLESLKLVAPYTDKKIWINENGEKFFIYGRDIFKNSIAKISPNVKTNEKIIVLNLKNEPLGIGILKIPPKNFEKISDKKVVLENVADVGWYIRKAG